jgi:hypothetical protein
MKTLFAGPFIGELGWELFCWQGFLRKIAPGYDRVVVACRVGHDALYADFADDILHFNGGGVDETDMWDNRSVDKKDVMGFCRYYGAFAAETEFVPFDAYSYRWWNRQHWSKRQAFVGYGEKFDVQFVAIPDILLHIRDTNKCGTGFRNWPVEHVVDVIRMLTVKGFTVGCIGKADSSAYINGYGIYDYRDLDFKSLTQLMARAKLIIGPQSGPTHLATLCGLPQLCWQTHHDHVDRVARYWNPFRTRVKTLPSPDASYWRQRKMWLPDSSVILNEAKRILEDAKC